MSSKHAISLHISKCPIDFEDAQYQIAGQASALVCNDCRENVFVQRVVMGILFLAVSGILLFYGLGIILGYVNSPKEGLGTLIAIATLPIFTGPLALAALINLVTVFNEGLNGTGERIAIALKRDAFKSQGWDKFWTTKERKNLKT